MNSLFNKIYLAVQALLDRNDGQGLTEYALAFTVIALGTVAGESAVAQQVSQVTQDTTLSVDAKSQQINALATQFNQLVSQLAQMGPQVP